MPGIACDIPSLSWTWLALASVSVEYTQLHWSMAQHSAQRFGAVASAAANLAQWGYQVKHFILLFFLYI